MTARWERWTPLAGVLAVAGMFVGFAIDSGSPSSNDSDAKIASYYTSHSHQVRSILTFFVFLAGILFLLFFFSVLRVRLVAVEEGLARVAAFAFGAGIASAVLWMAAAILFTGTGMAANDTGKFNVDPNTFRLVNDTGYLFWVSAVVVGALVVWATSAVALRTGLLPRWFGWLGILVGVLQLFAILFIPVFIYWGWILVAAVLLAWRPTAPDATTTA